MIDDHPLDHGRAAIAAKDHEAAVRIAAEHALLGPAEERVEALVMMADALDLMQCHEQARHCYRSALLIDRGCYEALYGLALIDASLGRREDARLFAAQGLRVVLEAAPIPIDAATAIAELLFDLDGHSEVVAIVGESRHDLAQLLARS